MHVGLLTDLAGQRLWHKWLAVALTELGHSLIVLHPRNDAVVGLPSSLQLALWLDPMLFKLKGEHAFDKLDAQTIAGSINGPQDQKFDVLIDASCCERVEFPAMRRIRLLFNDEPSELAAVSAALTAQPIVVRFEDGDGEQRELARPGIERRECLSCALDNIFSAVVELLVERVNSPSIHDQQRADLVMHGSARHAAGTQYLAKAISAKIANKISSYLDRTARVRSTWGLGVRCCDDGAALIEAPWPRTATFDLVPDDNLRYFADPFVFTHGGRTHLFVEEFPMATGRGIISVAELDTSGRVGMFRPVLETGFHLSYPFIFAHDDAVWMIPEASESGSVDLYRAVNYPDRWEFDRRLLDGVPGCDATVVKFNGRYFMVLTATRWLGTTWDKQRIYYADSPLGPWTEIEGGLVRIDCTRSRPAGAPLYLGERILRPAQDCSRAYGGSMTILEVQHLSPSICRERPVAQMRAVAAGVEFDTHTYSRHGRFEVVDLGGNFGETRQITVACTPIAG